MKSRGQSLRQFCSPPVCTWVLALPFRASKFGPLKLRLHPRSIGQAGMLKEDLILDSREHSRELISSPLQSCNSQDPCLRRETACAKPCFQQPLQLRKKALSSCPRCKDVAWLGTQRGASITSLLVQERKPGCQRWKMPTQRKPKAGSHNSPGEARPMPVSPMQDWDLALCLQLPAPPHPLQRKAALTPRWPREDSCLQTFTQQTTASQAVNLFKKP